MSDLSFIYFAEIVYENYFFNLTIAWPIIKTINETGKETSADSTLIPINTNANTELKIPRVTLVMITLGFNLIQKEIKVEGNKAKPTPTIDVTTLIMLLNINATKIPATPIIIVDIFVLAVNLDLDNFLNLPKKSLDKLVDKTKRNVSAEDMTAANNKTNPIPNR